MENKTIRKTDQPQKLDKTVMPETIPSLQKEIANLRKENAKLQKEKSNHSAQIKKAENKIFARDTTILTLRNQKAKSEERFTKVQIEYKKMKKVFDSNPDLVAKANEPPEIIRKLLSEIVNRDMSQVNLLDEHDEPPKK